MAARGFRSLVGGSGHAVYRFYSRCATRLLSPSRIAIGGLEHRRSLSSMAASRHRARRRGRRVASWARGRRAATLHAARQTRTAPDTPTTLRPRTTLCVECPTRPRRSSGDEASHIDQWCARPALTSPRTSQHATFLPLPPTHPSTRSGAHAARSPARPQARPHAPHPSTARPLPQHGHDGSGHHVCGGRHPPPRRHTPLTRAAAPTGYRWGRSWRGCAVAAPAVPTAARSHPRPAAASARRSRAATCARAEPPHARV